VTDRCEGTEDVSEAGEGLEEVVEAEALVRVLEGVGVGPEGARPHEAQGGLAHREPQRVVVVVRSVDQLQLQHTLDPEGSKIVIVIIIIIFLIIIIIKFQVVNLICFSFFLFGVLGNYCHLTFMPRVKL
jgi:hypothetical protein